MRSTSSTADARAQAWDARAWGWQGWLRAAWAAALALALARALGWDAGAGALAAVPSLCAFHRLTGWDCPGCGMTRAALSLLRGDWRGAWALHPFSLPLAGAALLAALAPAERVERFGRSRAGTALAGAALALLLAWWAWAKVLPHLS